KRWFNWRGQLPAPSWLPWVYDMPEPPQMRPDLIVSSGGKTCIANAWLASCMHCPNVFIGDIRGLSPDLFDHILTLDTSNQGDPRYVIGIPPTTIDPQELRAAADVYFEESPQAGRDVRYWSLLLGGNTNCGAFVYSRRDWDQLADAVAILAERHGIRWLITTSRRTGRTAESIFRHKRLQPYIEDLYLYGKDDRNIFNAFLACADAVFCTEDSGTMLTESVASARPVFSIRPPQSRLSRPLENMLNFYVQQRRIKRLNIADMNLVSVEDVTTGFNPGSREDLHALGSRLLDGLQRAA
ncbi:MAG: ELM1/GtrOC1 family putative glycosyltransferase, partial [Maioricimonas sp. JB049]